MNFKKKSKGKKKKESWKEKLRERQMRYQRAFEAYQVQKQSKVLRKSRNLSKSKMFFTAICLLFFIFGAFFMWQFTKTPEGSKDNPTQASESEPTYIRIYIKADGQVYPSTVPILKIGSSNYVFTADIHGWIIVEKNDIVIDGAGHFLQGIGESIGIDLSGRRNVTVKCLKIKDFDCGINLNKASYNTLYNNSLVQNHYGICLVGASYNIVYTNNIIEGECGVLLENSLDNNVSQNVIAFHNEFGMVVRFSNNNIICENSIKNNTYGIVIENSNQNRIYYNSFLYNIEQVNSVSSVNTWDDGKEGNYWSDYKERYPSAGEIGGSGVWNTPYVVDNKNVDNFPLVNPKV